MKTVIKGTDWSSSKGDKGVKCSDLKFDYPNDEQENETKKENEVTIDPNEFFARYTSLFGHADCISPINLGIYMDGEENLHSTQFIGVMPLVDLKNLKPKICDNEVCGIQIDSRFHISPSDMLREVLDGNDYYENPDMLQCNAYRIAELKDLFGRGEKNKVLCGTIKDIGKVSVEQSQKDGENGNSLEPLLSSVYPIFEIIRFVNSAKEVCKKNLKQQSTYKEENLVGKIKGRILINKQIKQNLSRGQYHKTYCAYNALSENIKENIILKYTLHLCNMLPISDSLKEDIMFCNRALANVPLKKCSISDFVGLKTNGVFRQYTQALDAAKAIIKRYYISYDTSSDGKEGNNGGAVKVADYSIVPYFIDMNLLFEYYCRALFRKAIDEINSKSSDYILEMDSATEKNFNLFNDKSNLENFYMKEYIPDIVIRYRRKTAEGESKILTVIDAKYSDVEHSGEKRARTHQILFYMNVLDSHYGGLISPYTGELSDVVSGNYLYAAKDESRQELSRQKLCYIPLGKNNSQNYQGIIKTYLEGIIEKKQKSDEEELLNKDVKNDIEKLVNTVEKYDTDGTISYQKGLKEKIEALYNTYKQKINSKPQENNIEGE